MQTISPHFRLPYSEQFSFSIQRDLPLHLFWETSYVGSLSRRLLLEPDINQPSFAILAALPSTTNYLSVRPYAGYAAIQQFISGGTSNYHGLQTSVIRRTGQVTFMGTFTWSKNLGDTSSDTSNDNDYFNPHVMYGPVNSTSSAGSMDIEKVFVGTFVWRLPTLQHQSMYLRGPIGGWQLSVGYFTIVGTTPILSGSRMADYIGGPADLPDPGPNGWFNPAAFAAAPQGRWGTTGAGDPGPWSAKLQPERAKVFRPQGEDYLAGSRGFHQRVQQRELPGAGRHHHQQRLRHGIVGLPGAEHSVGNETGVLEQAWIPAQRGSQRGPDTMIDYREWPGAAR